MYQEPGGQSPRGEDEVPMPDLATSAADLSDALLRCVGDAATGARHAALGMVNALKIP